MAAARNVNKNCRFFAVTSEVNPARLKKWLGKPAASQDAAVDFLVHLHKPLATSVIGHNHDLLHLLDLADWVKDSPSWV